MESAFLVGAVRTPVGRRGGALADAHPADLGGRVGPGGPYAGSVGWRARYGDQEISQFRSADDIAAKWGLSRADLDEYALSSHRRALRAIDEDRFAAEIVAYGGCATDECPRR